MCCEQTFSVHISVQRKAAFTPQCNAASYPVQTHLHTASSVPRRPAPCAAVFVVLRCSVNVAQLRQLRFANPGVTSWLPVRRIERTTGLVHMVSSYDLTDRDGAH